MVLVGQDFIEFMALLERDTNEVGVVQGGKVVTTIIVVVFHDLLPFPHHCLDTRLLICLSLRFLSFFGVRGVSDLGLWRETLTQIAINTLCI